MQRPRLIGGNPTTIDSGLDAVQLRYGRSLLITMLREIISNGSVLKNTLLGRCENRTGSSNAQNAGIRGSIRN